MHELIKLESNTEGVLEKNYTKVGEHFYIHPNQKLKIEEISEDVKKNYQIVFLMGGGGTRLLHITKDQISKHMIEINGQPLSKYVYDLWRNKGFSNFCFLIDDTQKAEMIKKFYNDGKSFGTEIKYSIEHERLGSGGALKLAIDNGTIQKSFVSHFPDDEIVGYKNFSIDFVKICEAAKKLNYWTVIACVPGSVYPYGEVVDKNGKVIDFVEKPFIRKDSSVGLFWMSKKAFQMIKNLNISKGEIKIERTVLKKIAQMGKMLKVLLPSEYWIPVNDDLNLKKFEEVIKTYK